MQGPHLIRNILLLARTVCHLRPAQIYYRLLRRFQASLPPPPRKPAQIEMESETLHRVGRILMAWEMDSTSRRLQRADDIVDGTFQFVGETVRLRPIPWNELPGSRLWRYQMHACEYLVDLALSWRMSERAEVAETLRRLPLEWIAESVPGRGIGWEAYPLSRRLVAWTYALSLAPDAFDEKSRAALLESMGRQATFLERRLEFDVGANHLIANLKALAVCGSVMKGASAERWIRQAVPRLWEEVHEQILADGTHYERSPTYHLIVLVDLLEVVGLLRGLEAAPIPPVVEEMLDRMLESCGLLVRPDGRVHLFNDSALDMTPDVDRVGRLAREVCDKRLPTPTGTIQLKVAGYFGYHDPSTADRLLIDCGEPAAPHQPGHAHCDLLSYTLDIEGKPAIVDSGTHGYEGSPFREYGRSTRAHNTLTVGGREQHEVWSTFRMARRARIEFAECRGDGQSFRFRGAYRPYHDTGVLHQRTIERIDHGWLVQDRVESAGNQVIRSFVHFAPGTTVDSSKRARIRARLLAADLVLELDIFGVARVEVQEGAHDPFQGWYSPEFGKAIPIPTLVLTAADPDSFGYRIRYTP